MSNPFMDGEPEAPANYLQQAQEVAGQTPEEVERQLQDVIAKMASANTSGMGGEAKAKQKKGFLLVALLLIVLAAGGVFFLFGMGQSPSRQVAAPVAPVAPVDPVAPAAAEAPLTPPVAPTTASEAVGVADSVELDPVEVSDVDECEQQMINHALVNGADAIEYIQQNQAYLAECRKALAAGAK